MKISKLRKIVYALCMSIILCSISSLNVYAEDNLTTDATSSVTVKDKQLIDEAIAEYDEYLTQDIDELLNQCESEKSAVTKDFGIIKNESGENYEVPIYSFDEIIYEKDAEKVIADTYIYDIPNPELKAGSTDGSSKINSTDASGSVKGWCTLYYTITTNADGLQFRKITTVSGGYTILDNAFSVISQKVEVNQTGTDLSTGMSEERFGPVYPTVNPWSYPTKFSHSVSTSFDHYMSAKYQMTVKRQSTWTFEIVNTL